jgi:hypothetical protein
MLEQIDAAIQSGRERAKRPRLNPGNHDAPLVSLAENKFRALATDLGWEVHRSGWPDFFLTRGGELLLVEVKGAKDRLRPSQVSLFTAFESHGIHVKIWWSARPESLIPWRDFLRITQPRHKRVGTAGRGVPLK